MCEPVENRSIKKAHPSLEPVVDPIFPFKHEFGTSGYNEYCPLVGAGGPSLAKIWAPDMDFLEQLLDDMQSMPPLDDTNSFIVTCAGIYLGPGLMLDLHHPEMARESSALRAVSISFQAGIYYIGNPPSHFFFFASPRFAQSSGNGPTLARLQLPIPLGGTSGHDRDLKLSRSTNQEWLQRARFVPRHAGRLPAECSQFYSYAHLNEALDTADTASEIKHKAGRLKRHQCMFAFYDEVPTSTSLLLQCGYRSKVCTNHRATKLDGTLHKLCEFHRRKANLNQQRLHRRQREKRARIQQSESTSKESGLAKARPTKKARPSLEPIVDLVAQSPTDSYSQMSGSYYYPQYTPLVNSKLGSADMDILELLLLDTQPQTLPPLEAFLPSNADDDSGSIAVLIRAME
ncbi:hypothetical protein C6341_g15039 [Phytophthora cactorum]|nr:hypothetical protein C6341_g15039 [Phytophthora cactorum]